MDLKNKKVELVLISGIILITLYTLWSLKREGRGSSISWEERRADGLIVLTSPQFNVQGIHKSMMGPTSAHEFVLNDDDSRLLWLTSYEVATNNQSDHSTVSDEFICHNNLDYNKAIRNTLWKSISDTSIQYPRLFTLTQGQTSLRFPEGFGFPIFSNEPLTVRTQVLNLNHPDTSFDTRHEVRLGYVSDNKMKPLFERSIFVMLPTEGLIDTSKTTCLPVNPNDHRYKNTKGGVSTGHWLVPPGLSTYSHIVNSMLNLQKDVTLHYAGIHAHPFARYLILKDLTLDSVLLKIKCQNYLEGKGLKKIEVFSSKKGILLSHLHDYELLVQVNNTTSEPQDMMASMFLYFYDQDLDNKLKKSGLKE